MAADPPRARHEADDRRDIARLAAAFFDAVSFEPGESPRHDRLHALFLADGLLVNASGGVPEPVGVDAFVRTRLDTFHAGQMTRYRVAEISETTEVFGHVAHRAAAFARTGERQGQAFEARGMIFMQCVRGNDGWRLSAVAWDDQRPGQSLAGHAEPTEFG